MAAFLATSKWLNKKSKVLLDTLVRTAASATTTDFTSSTTSRSYCIGHQQELKRPIFSKQPIIELLPQGKTLTDFIAEKSRSSYGRQDVEDSFFVADVGRIFNLYKSWTIALPNVHPYYAVKCNPDPVLLKILAFLGAGFDCASKNEIETVLDLDVSPDRVVYSTPDKQMSYLRYAGEKGVSLMSVDSEEELIKIKENCPSAQLLIRLVVRKEDGSINKNTKFGCSLDDGKHLLEVAKSLELNMVGISFHIGPGHSSMLSRDKFYKTFINMMQDSAKLFEYASGNGYDLALLNIGGGFEGNKMFDAEFIEVAAQISSQLDEFKEKFKNARVIAEPGHYLACSPFTLATCVINKKKARDGSQMYITTDGLHNSFMSLVIFPTVTFLPKLLKVDEENADASVHKCSLWGPKSLADKISDDFYLPNLNIGDWLYFENMGAYSLSLNAGFNGFPKPSIYYYIKESNKRLVEDILPLERG